MMVLDKEDGRWRAGGRRPAPPRPPAVARGSARRGAQAPGLPGGLGAGARARGRPGGAGGGVIEPEGGRCACRVGLCGAACRLESPRISAQWRSASGVSSLRPLLSPQPSPSRRPGNPRGSQSLRPAGAWEDHAGPGVPGERGEGPPGPWGDRRFLCRPTGSQSPERAGGSLAQRKKVSRHWPVALCRRGPGEWHEPDMVKSLSAPQKSEHKAHGCWKPLEDGPIDPKAFLTRSALQKGSWCVQERLGIIAHLKIKLGGCLLTQTQRPVATQ